LRRKKASHLRKGVSPSGEDYCTRMEILRYSEKEPAPTEETVKRGSYCAGGRIIAVHSERKIAVY